MSQPSRSQTRVNLGALRQRSSQNVASPMSSPLSSMSSPISSLESDANSVASRKSSKSWLSGEIEKAFYPSPAQRNSLRIPEDGWDLANERTPSGASIEKEQPAPPAAPSHSDFPDGGAKAWSVVAGAWCCLFCSLGWISCIGVYQTYYSENLLSQYDGNTIAWIPSLEACLLFMCAPMWGKIFDGYGPMPLLLIGTFFHVFGLMMTSLCTKYYQFILAQSICSAFGTGAIFYAGNNACTTWWQKKRGLAMGVVSMGSSLSGVLMPIMAQNLFPQIGFPWTMRAQAFTFLGLLIIAIATVRSRLDHKPKPWQFMEFIRPFKEAAFVCVSAGSFFFFWGCFLPPNFIILEAMHEGTSEYLAEYMIPIIYAGSAFGRIIPAAIGDRVGRFNVMVFITFFSAIITLAMWIPATGNAAIIVYCIIFGFSSGTFLSMIPTIVAEISDVKEIGVRNGSNFFIISIAMLTGNPIGGAIVSRMGGSYLGLQLFGGISMLVGACFFLAARTVQCGFVFKRI